MTDAAGEERCADTDEAQRSAFERLSGASTVVRQPQEGGRVFFVFDVENPPVSYVVHDPEARDAEAYAGAQGFDWGRELDDGWSTLGHISDVEQQSSMWVG